MNAVLSSWWTDPGADGVAGRLRVRLHRRELDRRLAAGADPEGRPELRRRAAELLEPKVRGRIAAALERVCGEAEGPARPFESVAPLARSAICDCAAEIRPIVARLDAGTGVGPRAVARAAVLLHDDDSPLYSPRASAAELRQALAAVAAEIEAG